MPDTDAGQQRAHHTEPPAAPLPVSYAWYAVRLADWYDSGMALQCGGQAGGVFTDDGAILGKIRDGDSLDALIRMADEHRPRCEWAVCPDDERGHPELTVRKRDEVYLIWTKGRLGDKTLAVLHRLDHDVWDAWLHPTRLEGQTVRRGPPVRLTPHGISYEMALLAVFRAMGDEMPENFRVGYLSRGPESDALGA